MGIKHAYQTATADDPGSEVSAGEWNADHVIDTYVDMPAIATPAAPGAGVLRFMARNRAGQMLPGWIGPSGLDYNVQPSLFGNSQLIWQPGTGTTTSIAMGSTWTARNATGVQSHPTQAATNIYTAMRRAEFAAGAVVNQASGIQSSAAMFHRGNVAGAGGFLFMARIGFGAATAGSRFFVGLSAQNATWTTDPTAVNNVCGLGAAAADTNLQLITHDAAAVTKVDTGLAKTTTAVPLDFWMWCAPNSNKITFRLTRYDTGAVLVDNVEVTTTLPVATVFMYAWANACSSAAAASTLGLAGLYCMSDI